MGKDRKSRHKPHKQNPTGLYSVKDIENEDESFNKEKIDANIERIMEQITSINMEEKLTGIQSIGAISSEQSAAIILSKSDIIKTLGPLLVDNNNIVRSETASAFRSIADNGGEEAISNLLVNDIITPLAALLKLCYSTWHPNIDCASKAKKSIDYEKDIFIQAASLLWTLSERNDIVIKRCEEEGLLNVLLPFLNTQIYDLETSIVAIQCILTLSEENLLALNEIELKKDQVYRLLNLEVSDNLNEMEVVMLKTLAAGLMINMYNGFSKNPDITAAGKSLTILSNTLSISCWERVQKLMALIQKDENSLTHDTKKKIKDVKTLINAQIQAVETLANLCTEDSESISDQSDSCDIDEDDQQELYDEIVDDQMNGLMNEDVEMNSVLCIEAIEIIKKEELVKKVLDKTEDIPMPVQEIFQTNNEGLEILKKLNSLRCSSFLCLANLISNLNIDTIGGVTYLLRIWDEMVHLVFHKIGPENIELLDAATSTMRSIIQKLNELQINSFKNLTLADLQPLLNGERQCPCPNTRASLINILGILSVILVKSDLMKTEELIKNIADFLINSCLTETEVWVISEAVDALMDIFAEDETDKMALEMSLVPRLNKISSILQTKFHQQKSTLGSNIPVVITVKVNLKRFLKYKGRRVSLLRI